MEISLGAPDLVVSDTSAPLSAVLGETIHISWTVTNQGSSDALADWQDAVYVSENANFYGNYIRIASCSTASHTPIAAGGSYTITMDVNIPDIATGNRFLIFYTDWSTDQSETSDSNNWTAEPILLDAPDLTVSFADGPDSARLDLDPARLRPR